MALSEPKKLYTQCMPVCMHATRSMAASPAPQHYSGGRPRVRLDADADIDGPSASSADHTRRPGLNLFSGTASAALFASLALCLLLVCAYSYVARRRAISGARRRFLGRVRDLELVPGRGRPSRRADVPRVAKTTLSPAARAADSSSGPAGDCPVCLEPLRGADDVAAAHACRHVFHARCIESWLDRCDSCPVCRCTVSCGLDPASEAATTVVGGACRLPLPETVVVVIAAETAAWATGSDDDEMMRRSTTSTGAVVTAQ